LATAAAGKREDIQRQLVTAEGLVNPEGAGSITDRLWANPNDDLYLNPGGVCADDGGHVRQRPADARCVFAVAEYDHLAIDKDFPVGGGSARC